MKLTASTEAFISRQSAMRITTIGLCINALAGLVDFTIGSDVSLALFYLIPIAFVAWYADTKASFLLAISSSLIWYGANTLDGALDRHLLINITDLGSKLAFYTIFAVLVARQRGLLNRERTLSRTDFLTGALNRRAFFEIASLELERTKRHTRPFTLTYFDLDNFKVINDRHGHATGDKVLQRIVNTARTHLRVTDTIARLGGDEFVLLLPEADQAAAQAVVEKICAIAQDDMNAQSWPITLSVGVLTCEQPPASVDALLRAADQLMYRVKQQGKNAILYAAYGNSMAPPDQPREPTPAAQCGQLQRVQADFPPAPASKSSVR